MFQVATESGIDPGWLAFCAAPRAQAASQQRKAPGLFPDRAQRFHRVRCRRTQRDGRFIDGAATPPRQNLGTALSDFKGGRSLLALGVGGGDVVDPEEVGREPVAELDIVEGDHGLQPLRSVTVHCRSSRSRGRRRDSSVPALKRVSSCTQPRPGRRTLHAGTRLEFERSRFDRAGGGAVSAIAARCRRSAASCRRRAPIRRRR